MPSTVNVLVSSDWTEVAREGSLIVTADSKIGTLRFAVGDGGAPGDDVNGHLVPRDDNLFLSLEGSESLYLRIVGIDPQNVSVTADNPVVA